MSTAFGIIFLGIVFNLITAIPYYQLVEKPHFDRDPVAERETLVGTFFIAAIPWLYFTKVVLVLVIGLLLLFRRKKTK